MKLALILSTIVLLFFVCWISGKITDEPLYAKKKGLKLQSKPFHNINTRSETSCLMECENFAKCRHLNFIKIADNKEYICELFDCSVSLANGTLVEADNSTFYSVEWKKKGTDCQALKKSGWSASGRYTVTSFDDCSEIQVYCDMTEDDGDWIMMQKRFNGSVDFFRNWDEYKNGFGSLNGEFWLGLENAYQLMKDCNVTLRFDMWNGTEHAYMEYYEATISDETDKYRLNWHGTPAGNAGDSMSAKSKNQRFVTIDQQFDWFCKTHFRLRWWLDGCFEGNLNGDYHDPHLSRIFWHSFTGNDGTLSKTGIKFKCNN